MQHVWCLADLAEVQAFAGSAGSMADFAKYKVCRSVCDSHSLATREMLMSSGWVQIQFHMIVIHVECIWPNERPASLDVRTSRGNVYTALCLSLGLQHFHLSPGCAALSWKYAAYQCSWEEQPANSSGFKTSPLESGQSGHAAQIWWAVACPGSDSRKSCAVPGRLLHSDRYSRTNQTRLGQ